VVRVKAPVVVVDGGLETPLMVSLNVWAGILLVDTLRLVMVRELPAEENVQVGLVFMVVVLEMAAVLEFEIPRIVGKVRIINPLDVRGFARVMVKV
jgi:hypothetical protein